MTDTINRRRFITLAGAGATVLAAAGCGGTYDIASGFVSPSAGTSGHDTLVYWNLLTGGDGSHMTAMEDVYRRAHPNVSLDATVLDWGNPYYTKLAMAIRAGSPPDLAIMHLSRLNGFVPPGLLEPYDLGEMAAHGMTPADFTPLAFHKAQFNGRQMAIPLDTHPFVQYFNTKLCRKAGLLDSSGMLRPISGSAQLLTVLRKLKSVGATPAVCDQINDPATPWRLFYTLYSQAGGRVLADQGKRVVLDRPRALQVLRFISQLAREKLLNADLDANGGVAAFASGTAGLYWEGEWNVDTFQAAKLPFSMQAFPPVFGSNDAAQADSHTFVMPIQPGGRDPERTTAILTLVHTLLTQSITWASGGHIPAWLPVRHSAAYQKLKPESNYESVADRAVYDPPAWYSGSGSNLENYAGGVISGVMIGASSPEEAYDSMHGALENLATQSSPV